MATARIISRFNEEKAQVRVLYDLLYNPFGLSIPFFVIGALIGGIRAKRRNRSGLAVMGISLGIGFVTWVLFAVLIFAGVMILWGMSV